MSLAPEFTREGETSPSCFIYIFCPRSSRMLQLNFFFFYFLHYGPQNTPEAHYGFGNTPEALSGANLDLYFRFRFSCQPAAGLPIHIGSPVNSCFSLLFHPVLRTKMVVIVSKVPHSPAAILFIELNSVS